jgi:hypothetical protein
MELLDDDYRSQNLNRSIDDLVENGYQTDASRYIREGFELFKKEPGLLIVYLLVVGLISWALSEVRLGQLAQIFIGPCLTAGWYIVARRLSHNKSVEFKQFFDGFKQWQRLVPVYLIGAIFMVIGFIFLVIPGIYLAVAYIFIIPITLFYDRELPLVDVLEGSRKVVTKKWWNLFGLLWLILGINILGALALGFGLLVSVPTSVMALYMAYEDIFGVPTEDLEEF